MRCRNLILILGDQLTLSSAALKNADKKHDCLLMMELREEATYVAQHKIRLVLFFSAMRHFRDELKQKGFQVHYVAIGDADNRDCFEDELSRWLKELKPKRLICLEPGDFRVKSKIVSGARQCGTPLRFVTDTHFLSAIEEFRAYAEGKDSLLLEYFYRHMRRKTGILMRDGAPEGGNWNFDKENRRPFGKSGPPETKAPRSFQPDQLTEEVIALVKKEFSESPARLEEFDLPVTHDQARTALRDFIKHRLNNFGTYQDIMAIGRPYLYHSRLSAALNLHLLDPQDAISAATKSYELKNAAINDVEGFVRQILGWREFVRGIYWTRMPNYANMNALSADLDMPAFMWTAETEMTCVRQCIGQLIDHAYAHHIQRLMVLGLFCMLLGVRPYDVHRWHMSMYADAIAWVSLPNVLGMSQFGDGGIVGTKPYCASGNYISRMSDYCANCRFDPAKATGDDACPFTTLYWDFLSRNRNRLKQNRRLQFQFKNLDRKTRTERQEIRRAAGKLAKRFTNETYL